MNEEARKDGDHIDPLVETHAMTLQDHGVGTEVAPPKPFGSVAPDTTDANASSEAAVTEVKDGSVKDVMKAVGNSTAKARFALRREVDKPEKDQRSTLIRDLEQMLEESGERVEAPFDDNTDLEGLVHAARTRGINVPDDSAQLNPDALRTVLKNSDAARKASENAVPPEQLNIEREVEREAGYQPPEYEKAQEQGFFGNDLTDNGDSYPEPGNAIRQPGIL